MVKLGGGLSALAWFDSVVKSAVPVLVSAQTMNRKLLLPAPPAAPVLPPVAPPLAPAALPLLPAVRPAAPVVPAAPAVVPPVPAVVPPVPAVVPPVPPPVPAVVPPVPPAVWPAPPVAPPVPAAIPPVPPVVPPLRPTVPPEPAALLSRVVEVLPFPLLQPSSISPSTVARPIPIAKDEMHFMSIVPDGKQGSLLCSMRATLKVTAQKTLVLH
jgi:hypothetical protein